MGKPLIDMVGMKFGRLSVVAMAEKPENATPGAYWECICDCGEKVVAKGVSLRRGKPKSCGCQKREASSRALKKTRLQQSGTIEDRFFSRFSKSQNGCWEWHGHKDKDGYGILPTNGPSIRAHRFSIHKLKGIDPAGYVVCHSCDNPSCVNPDHLFIGMPVDNVGDMLDKQRDKMVGSRNNKAKLDESSALEIFNSKDSYEKIKEKYNISNSTITRIKKKKLWRHIHNGA